MANAAIVDAWTDNVSAYQAVRVAEGGAQGNKEYIGSVSLTDDLAAVGFPGQTWAQLSAANKKEALRIATKVVRDAQQPARTAVAGITGTVVI